MSLVSIVIPLYNCEKYVEKCLDALLNQTYKDIEIIIVNDGSTDKGKEICDEYAEKHKNIKVIDKSNGGVSSAWIQGLEYANGEYIGFMDPDDYCESDYYETLLNNLLATKSDIVVCGYVKESEDGKILKKVTPSTWLKCGVYDTEELVFIKQNYYQKHLTVLPAKWAKLIKRNLVMNNIALYDKTLSLGDDIGITIATFFDSSRVSLINYFGYHYVQHDRSITHQFKEKLILNYESLYNNIRKICNEKKYSEMYVNQEMLFQLISVTGLILTSDNRRKEKINYLKKLRNLNSVRLALAAKGTGLTRNENIIRILFKYKMFGLLIFLASIKKN